MVVPRSLTPSSFGVTGVGPPALLVVHSKTTPSLSTTRGSFSLDFAMMRYKNLVFSCVLCPLFEESWEYIKRKRETFVACIQKGFVLSKTTPSLYTTRAALSPSICDDDEIQKSRRPLHSIKRKRETFACLQKGFERQRRRKRRRQQQKETTEEGGGKVVVVFLCFFAFVRPSFFPERGLLTQPSAHIEEERGSQILVQKCPLCPQLYEFKDSIFAFSNPKLIFFFPLFFSSF